jgi:hypothetical protein
MLWWWWVLHTSYGMTGMACVVLFPGGLQEIFPGDPSFVFVFEVRLVGQSARNIVVLDFFLFEQILVFGFGRCLPLRNRRWSHPCPSYLPGFFEFLYGDAQKVLPAGPILGPNLVRVLGQLVGTGAIVFDEFFPVSKTMTPCNFPCLGKGIHRPLFPVCCFLVCIVFGRYLARR